MVQQSQQRRPLASRNTGWANRLARLLLATPITPNMISLFGIGFAAIGAALLAFAPMTPWLFLVAAVMVQLRLLCNLLDGMVAVEGGRHSPTGALYNEAPDRVEDCLLLIGCGYAALLPELGYLAAIGAVATAYVRAFGASLGLGQDYRGPMAKPHRMAVLTAGAVLAFFEVSFNGTLYTIQIALAAILFGTAITCVRRLSAIASGLREQGQ
ncbi:CDP-alcohol phosphatidyltransferase family protein [Aureimonas fodinaquatilis]|uniref:CDP-alcohol phosphatidyltransferase family protein n=1 Tax=Aureimonas fodinaquatilis TaxID=2565783 RepID=A0A5B0DPV2_9HYPH|nr:CDP-alcohol phosphatidyltransferase family protein [Aureimonas fodinaquatilis]KAA0968506.1 CDP-alcohol phosphatidyltransferase family protein [Aureimonas fodinaquatilis]